MTLQTQGFLSSDIDGLALTAMTYVPRHMTLVDRVNRDCMAMLVKPRDITQCDSDLFTVTLLGRALQDFQAAVLLAKRGLRAQSRSMVRSTFESALYCAAAARDLMLTEGSTIKVKKGEALDTSFIEAVEGGHQRYRVQVAAELCKLEETPKAQADALSVLLDELGKPGKYPDISVKGLETVINFVCEAYHVTKEHEVCRARPARSTPWPQAKQVQRITDERSFDLPQCLLQPKA